MKYFYFLLLFFANLTIYSQSGFEIEINITSYQKDSIIISYPNGAELISFDTIKKSQEGFYIFKGNQDLKPGVYFIGVKRNLKKFSMIIKPDDDQFSVSFDIKNKYKRRFKGSPENKTYNDYFLTTLENKNLENLYKNNRQSNKRDSIAKLLNTIRKSFIEKNPNSLASKIIQSEITWTNPTFSGNPRNVFTKKIQYKIDHSLDNFDLKDDATMRIPNSHQALVDYFDKVVILKPEKINSKLDSVFNEMGFKSDLFKYYLQFFHNKYSRPFEKWVDETYIHITKNYYTKQKAPWLSEKEIDFALYQVERKSKTLIGKIIPHITLQTEDNQNIGLVDIEAEYTVLFFWRPGCSRCKYALPSLINLNKQYQNKKVKIVSVCTRQNEDSKICWEGVKKEKMEIFSYNLADKTGKTGFMREFNIGGLPMIYILDKDKKIIDKKVAHSVLGHVFEELMKSEK